MENPNTNEAGEDIVFPDGLQLMRPRVPSAEELAPYLAKLHETRSVSNFGPFCRQYEDTLSEMLEVEHCMALSNLSTGLMYMPPAAGLDGGEVILPSYTFVATAHSMKLGGLTPVFADIDPETFCLDPKSVEAAIGPDTVAICGVHIYGTPCDIEALEALAQKHGLALFFDSAHGIGSHRKGRPVGGFGLAEGFSTSVTKIFTTFGEGGFITTNDAAFAERIRSLRNWGRSGDDNSKMVGVVSKLPEIAAAAGLIELPRLAEYVERRRELMALAQEMLAEVPGIRFPKLDDGDGSGHKDFAVMVESAAFGRSRDALASALKDQGVESRAYFAPAIHQMDVYSGLNHRVPLSVTETAAAEALCLPFYNEMTDADMHRLCELISSIQSQ